MVCRESREKANAAVEVESANRENCNERAKMYKQKCVARKKFQQKRDELTDTTVKSLECTIQRGVRFMIRLQAKFDLAVPETDSEAESYEDMKCI